MGPAIEPPCGRAGVQPAHREMVSGRLVLAPIHQHIDEPIAHFARRAERPRMESAAPHGAPPTERAVECAREPYQKAHHSARKGRRVVSFDNQVNVIGLNRELDDAKPRPRRSGEPAPQGSEEPLLAQAR